MIEIICGDALAELRKLPSDHFHCVVTSPPYWGLRDYGTGAWEGGDPACEHVERLARQDERSIRAIDANSGRRPNAETYESDNRGGIQFRDICGKCGARRVDQQIGLEATPEAWVARLVEVFREVRRVLRSDGTCWVNLGDSYCSGASTDRKPGNGACGSWSTRNQGPRTPAISGLKPKDLVGQPWMLAFALRADGWWLRSEIIWAKPNPMPESVIDRPTKAHEQVFMLTKQPRYFYDAEAVREPHTMKPQRRFVEGIGARYANGVPGQSGHGGGVRLSDVPAIDGDPAGRNLRSVWTIATDPLPSVEVDGEKLDHYASFPIELARRCILAGTSAKGCCPECGAPWARAVETEFVKLANRRPTRKAIQNGADMADINSHEAMGYNSTTTTGWRPTCSCAPAKPESCRVLDCFGGSGRTALAAEELQRDCTLIELNPKSVAMARAQLERAKARRYIGDAERLTVAEGQLRLL